MPPSFPYTFVQEGAPFRNYSHTVDKPVPLYCEIDAGLDDGGRLKRHAEAVRAILRHCFAQQPPQRVRTVGSTWSFSKIIEWDECVINPGNMTQKLRVPAEHYHETYRTRAASGFTPVFAEGGTGIGALNATLAKSKLALQTSGAGDGHRIGGCIATGTHGSALHLGALHDTVLGMYLIVSPEQAVFIQPQTKPAFASSVAGWLEGQTQMPTRLIEDDQLFAAAIVSLGSLGFVFGVVLETTALYELQIRRLPFPANDPGVRRAIETLRPEALVQGSETPFHFDVVMHPYPTPGEDSWYATLMWQRPTEREPRGPLQGIPRSGSDTIGLIGKLVGLFSGPLTGALTQAFISGEIAKQLADDARKREETLLPGEVFGPTTLPPGHGASTEIVVDQRLALSALDSVFEALREQAQQHRYLLGCVAARFVPGTRALLGMNQFERNCYIELPSIRTPDVLAVYEAVWRKLEQKGINFTCHWGQLNCFTPGRVERYFGENAAQWRAARQRLLETPVARSVFASRILGDAGLGE
jgi:hypothetical protein